ncbi:MAG: hypothetical protein IT211_05995 [Armatimonadetes bacterium]|nr:hypothetical protein [Armatimonadota bacterium]
MQKTARKLPAVTKLEQGCGVTICQPQAEQAYLAIGTETLFSARLIAGSARASERSAGCDRCCVAVSAH